MSPTIRNVFWINRTDEVDLIKIKKKQYLLCRYMYAYGLADMTQINKRRARIER